MFHTAPVKNEYKIIVHKYGHHLIMKSKYSVCVMISLECNS